MKAIHKFLNLILFFAFSIFVGVSVFIYYKKTGEIQFASKAPSKVKLTPEELVNKYLKEGQEKVQTQQINSILTLKNTTPETAKKEKEIRIEDIPVDQQIAKNIKAPEQSLTEKFDTQAYDEQLEGAQSAQAKKEYARQYIENARKAGYHITLNDQLEVVSMKAIRKPTSQTDKIDTFESNPEE